MRHGDSHRVPRLNGQRSGKPYCPAVRRDYLVTPNGVKRRGNPPDHIGCDSLRTVGLPVDAPARLTLYVPHPESRLCTELTHGSAIVGLPLGNGEIRIYFEGNVIGASNLELFRARAAQAAGRMLHNYPSGYPTRAREDVDQRELVEVGSIEVHTGRLEVTARADELSWWIAPADLADLGFRLEAR
jgi:hypothetical protein